MMVERCWNGGEADGTVVERRLDFGGRMVELCGEMVE